MAQTEIGLLEARRRRLVAESDRLRQQLAGDVAALQSTATWVERGYSLAVAVREMWPVLAGAAGLFVARKRGGLLGAMAQILSWWRLGKKAMSLWRTFSPEPPQQ